MATLISVGSPRDPHIVRVHEYLEVEGIRTVVVPPWTEDPSEFAEVSWSLEEGWSFPPNSAFWLRNKHRIGTVASVDKQDEWWSLSSTMEFFRSAAEDALLSFNNSRAPSAGNSKIAQLQTARSCGFRLPKTLVSNDSNRIITFVESCSACIVKPLIAAITPDVAGEPGSGKYLPTTSVTADDVRAANPASFAVAPSIYQELVTKKCELRVIACGDEIVSFCLDSQARSFTSLDWRAGEPLIECALIETPSEIVAPIRAFLATSGLHSTVFDFAVTPDETVVFFESNPAGQWARMDGLHGHPVSRMFARQMGRTIRQSIAKATHLA